LEELEDDSNRASAPGGQGVFAQFVDFRAADPNLATGGAVEAGYHINQGSFAAARFADDGDKLTRFDAQVDVFEGEERPGVGLEGFGDRCEGD